jgi:hypothetical protein
MKKPLIHTTASIAISSILIASMAPPSSAQEGHEHPCKSEWRSEGDLTLKNQLPVQLGPIIGTNSKPTSLGFEAVFSVAAPQGCPGFRYVHSQFSSTTVLASYFKSNLGGVNPTADGFFRDDTTTTSDPRYTPGNLFHPKWTLGHRFTYDNKPLIFTGSKSFKFEDASINLYINGVNQGTQFIDVKTITAYALGEHHFEEVPGPLPLLGVAAAFGYSRKLRKRLKSNKLPVVSADD